MRSDIFHEKVGATGEAGWQDCREEWGIEHLALCDNNAQIARQTAWPQRYFSCRKRNYFVYTKMLKYVASEWSRFTVILVQL
jgi:hypothetical protein